MRRATSIVSASLKGAGARRSELSSKRATSALLREGRLPEPPKMTSSMPEPRMFLNDVSPITQRSASTRFDLPQPLGPTTPVRPGSILKSAESQKLLKPVRRKRSNFIVAGPRPLSRQAESRARSRPSRHDSSLRITLWDVKGLAAIPDPRNQPRVAKNLCETGLAHHRRQNLIKAVKAFFAVNAPAVDEERRRSLEVELVDGDVPHLFYVVEKVIILEAGVDALLGHAGGQDLGLQLDQRFLGEGPFVLMVEKAVEDRVALLGAGAAGQHEGGDRQQIEREFSQDELRLAGIDIFRLERRPDVPVERGAMNTGHRRIF